MAGPAGPLGQPRSIGVSILLAIVTIGIYTFVWVYKTHNEIKRHSGVGVGATPAYAPPPAPGQLPPAQPPQQPPS